MSPDNHPRSKALAIPVETYATLVDFCIGSLGLEDVPEEEDLGLVVAYLLGRGMKTVEDEKSPESGLEGLAS